MALSLAFSYLLIIQNVSNGARARTGVRVFVVCGAHRHQLEFSLITRESTFGLIALLLADVVDWPPQIGQSGRRFVDRASSRTFPNEKKKEHTHKCTSICHQSNYQRSRTHISHYYRIIDWFFHHYFDKTVHFFLSLNNARTVLPEEEDGGNILPELI